MTAPRLWVLTATETAGAVLLRRGPSNQVATLWWDRSDDSFRIGQWLKGRIHEHRSDLSPDGRHMIYFAYKGSGVGGYTVLSRAPWLRALDYRPQGHTWHGGGAFAPTGEVFFNGGDGGGGLPDGLRAAPGDAFPHSTDGFHMGDLFAAVMARRGWSRGEAGRYDLVLRKDIGAAGAIEQSISIGRKNRALVSSAFAIMDADGRRAEMPEWDWADRWTDGLHYASGGALWFARVGPGCNLLDQRQIRDFTDMHYERLAAPYEGVSR